MTMDNGTVLNFYMVLNCSSFALDKFGTKNVETRNVIYSYVLYHTT